MLCQSDWLTLSFDGVVVHWPSSFPFLSFEIPCGAHNFGKSADYVISQSLFISFPSQRNDMRIEHRRNCRLMPRCVVPLTMFNIRHLFLVVVNMYIVASHVGDGMQLSDNMCTL